MEGGGASAGVYADDITICTTAVQKGETRPTPPALYLLMVVRVRDS